MSIDRWNKEAGPTAEQLDRFGQQLDDLGPLLDERGAEIAAELRSKVDGLAEERR